MSIFFLRINFFGKKLLMTGFPFSVDSPVLPAYNNCKDKRQADFCLQTDFYLNLNLNPACVQIRIFHFFIFIPADFHKNR